MDVLLKFPPRIVLDKLILCLVSWAQPILCSLILMKTDRMLLALTLQFTYWYLDLLHVILSCSRCDYALYYISLWWVGLFRSSEWHWRWNCKSAHLKDLVLAASVTLLADVVAQHGLVYVQLAKHVYFYWITSVLWQVTSLDHVHGSPVKVLKLDISCIFHIYFYSVRGKEIR